MMTIATIVLAICTIAYAYITYRSYKLQEKNSAPGIHLYIIKRYMPDERRSHYLKVVNNGKKPATKIEITNKIEGKIEISYLAPGDKYEKLIDFTIEKKDFTLKYNEVKEEENISFQKNNISYYYNWVDNLENINTTLKEIKEKIKPS